MHKGKQADAIEASSTLATTTTPARTKNRIGNGSGNGGRRQQQQSGAAAFECNSVWRRRRRLFSPQCVWFVDALLCEFVCVCVVVGVSIWCTLWAKYLWHKVWFSIMQSPKTNKMRLQNARTKVCNTLQRPFRHFSALSLCLSYSLALSKSCLSSFFRIQTLWNYSALLPLQLNLNFHSNTTRKGRLFDAG